LLVWLEFVGRGLLLEHFPFDQKNSGIFEKRKNGTEISWEIFPKISEVHTVIQLKIPETPGTKSNGTEIPGKKFK